MSTLAIAAFGAQLKRARGIFSIEVPASESDEFRRVATESGFLFTAESVRGGWVRISCVPVPAGGPS
jgi:hypothetical protein